MADKKLKNMKRAQLLELLIARTEEVEQLRAELDRVKEELTHREISMEKAGTMAEAVLLVNGVLASAEAAGKQYEENIARMNRELEERCRARDEESRRQCKERVAEMNRKCEQMEQDTQLRCARLMNRAEQDANLKWDEMAEKMEMLQADNASMRQMLDEMMPRRKRK